MFYIRTDKTPVYIKISAKTILGAKRQAWNMAPIGDSVGVYELGECGDYFCLAHRRVDPVTGRVEGWRDIL